MSSPSPVKSVDWRIEAKAEQEPHPSTPLSQRSRMTDARAWKDRERGIRQGERLDSSRVSVVVRTLCAPETGRPGLGIDPDPPIVRVRGADLPSHGPPGSDVMNCLGRAAAAPGALDDAC